MIKSHFPDLLTESRECPEVSINRHLCKCKCICIYEGTPLHLRRNKATIGGYEKQGHVLTLDGCGDLPVGVIEPVAAQIAWAGG